MESQQGVWVKVVALLHAGHTRSNIAMTLATSRPTVYLVKKGLYNDKDLDKMARPLE